MPRCAMPFAIALCLSATAIGQERVRATVQATADELVLALCYNHAAFDARYARQRIVVTGLASSIRRNPDEEGEYDLAMRVGTRDCTGTVRFRFKDQQQELATLQPPHQQVTIEASMVESIFAEAGGIADVEIRFNDCTIVTAGPLSSEPAP